MKLSELQKNYGDVELDNSIVDKLEKYLIAPSWVGKNNLYFTVRDDGIVREEVYEGDEADYTNIDMGNFFQTEKEAEFDLERRKVEAKMLALGGSRNPKEVQDNYGNYWVIAITTSNKDYSLEIRAVFESDTRCYLVPSIYFPSCESIHEAIKTIGEDRIKKYLFYMEK